MPRRLVFALAPATPNFDCAIVRDERASILGPTLYFKGDLSADEDLLIQGRVEGSITHTQRLTVGAQGGSVTFALVYP